MVKLFENIFRSVNIALVNELAIMCRRLGLSVWEIIDAAATKPFGFMPFYPGPGIGGHCLPSDPYYSRVARAHDGLRGALHRLRRTRSTAACPPTPCSSAADALNDQGKPVKGSRILVLGRRLQARGGGRAGLARRRDHRRCSRGAGARGLRRSPRARCSRWATGGSTGVAGRPPTSRLVRPRARCSRLTASSIRPGSAREARLIARHPQPDRPVGRPAACDPVVEGAGVRLSLALLASLRPRQWVKNLFVFAGVIFSQQLLTPDLAGARRLRHLLRPQRSHLPLQRRRGRRDVTASIRPSACAPSRQARSADRRGGRIRRRAAGRVPGRRFHDCRRPSGSWRSATALSSRPIPSGSSTSSSSTSLTVAARLRAARGGGRGGRGRRDLGMAAHLHHPDRALPAPRQAPARVPVAHRRCRRPPAASWPTTARASSTR